MGATQSCGNALDSLLVGAREETQNPKSIEELQHINKATVVYVGSERGEWK